MKCLPFPRWLLQKASGEQRTNGSPTGDSYQNFGQADFSFETKSISVLHRNWRSKERKPTFDPKTLRIEADDSEWKKKEWYIRGGIDWWHVLRGIRFLGPQDLEL